jgi:hypothetical protein
VGTNRYVYADNDPVNKADNNGHAFPLAVAAAYAACGGGCTTVMGSLAAAAAGLAVSTTLNSTSKPQATEAPTPPQPGAKTPGEEAAKSAKDNAASPTGSSQKGGSGPHAISAKGTEAVKGELVKSGHEIIGEQIRVDTQIGTRVVDVIPKDTNGKIHHTEVKTNGGRYSEIQKAKDQEISKGKGEYTGKEAAKTGLEGDTNGVVNNVGTHDTKTGETNIKAVE